VKPVHFRWLAPTDDGFQELRKTMFKNYLKTAIRNIYKNKPYFLINIFGLATGLACCLLIIQFIADELSFDRFHRNADQIYRVAAEFHLEGKVDNFAHTPAPLAPVLRNEFPEVLAGVRLSYAWQQLVAYQDKQFWVDKFYLADPNIFRVFTFPFIAGDSSTALSNLNAIVITEAMAKQFFGNTDPIGKILTVGIDATRDYKVTGVLKNIPSNSQLQFDCLISFANQKANTGWGEWNYDTYLLLHPDTSAPALERKLTAFLQKTAAATQSPATKLHLQPLTRIHLFSNLRSDLPTNRDVKHLYFFALIAIIVLLIAGINFVNLATARSATREKEAGVRKVAGAHRRQLIAQFLSESILMAFLALLVALVLAELFLPVFNQLTNKNLPFNLFSNFGLLALSVATALLTGILAGIYPAVFLSGSVPREVLTGQSRYLKTSTLRKCLVVAQFVLSIIFISGTIVIHNQLKFIRSKNLGYNKEHLIVIPIFKREVRDSYPIYRDEILKHSRVQAAAATSFRPDNPNYHQKTWWEGMNENEWEYFDWMAVDYVFLKTFQIELLQGRDFSSEFSSDLKRAYILNESAVRRIGWKNPIGKQFDIVERGTVIGIVKDFHFQSLHNKITPLALNVYPNILKYLYVRVGPDNIAGTIEFLSLKWRQIYPQVPFQYSFYDEDYDRAYKSEMMAGKTFNYLAGLAMVIAGLGLFGLASFMAEKRTREIGIRKVLGAGVGRIVMLFFKEFTRWVVIANFLAIPIVLFTIRRWLQNFAYRIDIGWWLFALAGGLALGIALLTVSTQAVKAALANPVESLRYE